MTEIITMSSKGQIVVPKDLRERLGLDTGTNFAIFGKDDTLVLKRVDAPKAREVFEELAAWGREFAKKKGFKEEEVMEKIHKGRGIKSEK